MTVPVTTPEDFYIAFMPSYWASKIIGILHLSFVGKSPDRKLVVAENYIYLAIVRIVLVITVLVLFNATVDLMDFPEPITNVAQDIDVYCGITVSLIELVCALFSKQEDLYTIEQVIAIDRRLSLAGIRVDYINARKIAIIEIIWVFVQNTIKTIMLLMTTTYKVVLINSALNVMSMLNSFQLNEYINLMLMLRQRFNWLNRAIVRNYETKWRRGECKKSEIKQSIKAYGKIYNDLRCLAKYVNHTFGFFVLFSISSRFIMMNMQLIYFYTFTKANFGNALSYTSIVLNIIFHVYKLLLITCIPASTIQKGKETGKCLHQLWDLEPEIRDEVQHFSMQVAQQSPRFSALGFLQVDYTLITTILGSITTYLIIVIQFDINYNRTPPSCPTQQANNTF